MHGDPIQGVDPTGLFSIASTMAGNAIASQIAQAEFDAGVEVLRAVDPEHDAVEAYDRAMLALLAAAVATGGVVGAVYLMKTLRNSSRPLVRRLIHSRSTLIAALTRTGTPVQRIWGKLRLLKNSSGAAEAAAGTAVHKRLRLNTTTETGIYKFVIDRDGDVWLIPVGDDTLPHSALVPKGQDVRGAGYVRVENGKANVNGHSGHYMADDPFLGPEIQQYDDALRATFLEHGVIVNEHVPGPSSLSLLTTPIES